MCDILRSPGGLSPHKQAFKASKVMRSTVQVSVPWRSMFGSPSYPSPLDRIRTGRRERAAQFGLNTNADENSFEGNQSYPKIIRSKLKMTDAYDTPKLEKQKLIGDGFNDVSFSPGHSQGSFSPLPQSDSSQSFNESWSFCKFVGGGQTGVSFPTAVYNPNKAICIINPKTTEILTANKMSSVLFGCSNLIKRKLTDFISLNRDQQLISEPVLQADGSIINISGKVVETIDPGCCTKHLSLWIKELDCDLEPRCLAIMELVDLTCAHVCFTRKGTILSCDKNFLSLHVVNESEVIHQDITDFIPAVTIPDSKSSMTRNIKKQQTTGRTHDGCTFPLSIHLQSVEDEKGGGDVSFHDSQVYHGTVWVFAHIGGLLTINPDGSLRSINQNFASTLLGYNSEELIGENITVLLPDIYDVMEEEEAVPLPNDDSDNEWTDVRTRSRLGENENVSDEERIVTSTPCRSRPRQDNGKERSAYFTPEDSFTEDADVSTSSTNTADLVNASFPMVNLDISDSDDESEDPKNCSHGSQRTVHSTTSSHSTAHPDDIHEGSFNGYCQHKDGSLLAVTYQIRRVVLEDDLVLYCMWMSRDPSEGGEGGRSLCNLTMATSFNCSLDVSNVSLGEALAEKCRLSDSSNVSISSSDCDSSESDYSAHYETMHSIGKGAFGFVKLAYRRSDGVEAIVKFIRRNRVSEESWVIHDSYGEIPHEVSLLSTLDHPNIVKMLDCYQSDEFVQLIMEKHGTGMDLFEFIDRRPFLDEPLVSYMFRQIVSAISYLHSLNILHRDIKDENIVLDESFHIKLIDFGAATFMTKGKLFSTFFGTMEYCSPEVLLGNKYCGPELEMWTLGVTLYTLMFGENPFFDEQETIRCLLKPPFRTSRAFLMLIWHLLHADPQRRATVKDLERNMWVNQDVDIKLYKYSEVLPNCEFHANTDLRDEESDDV